jgi:two-component system sensor histidine kinase/response regulator
MKEPVILAVDDNPTNLDVLFDIFDNTNFVVSFVTDGESCLELANSDSPDLILLDVMMPGMDGFEVCRRLKAHEKTQHIPIIFMTALTDTVSKVKGFELGAVDYITKPIQPEEVLARVRTHFTIQQLQRDLRTKNEKLRTSNEELQASLEREKELNKLKSRFISVASHEFRSPLTLIGITANMLKRYNDRISDEKRIEHLKGIESSVQEMIDLLNNILVLSKAEAENFQFSPEPIDVENFCQCLVEKFTLMSAETHLITFLGTGEHIQIAADPKLLEPILSNLLSNAIKFSPVGGAIMVGLARDNENVIFRVTDKGIGISEADQQHLFDAFHRGENIGTTQGAGLGLSIVKQFVDLHSGTISVESEVNKGTTFTIILPIRDYQ